MATASDPSFISWKKSLPYSRLTRPDGAIDLAKYALWRCYTPCHPIVRDTSLTLGLVKHKGRQPFLVGKIAPHISLKDFVHFLIKNGYGNHFVAWRDDGETIGLRHLENFKYQYHIRIFEDGEVRAHYEYTPEYRPLLHYKGVNMEARREVFLKLMGDKIIPLSEE